MVSSSASNPTVALLQRAHSPASAEKIHAEKVQFKPLFLAPSLSTPPSIDARAARRRSRELKNARKCRKPKPFSAAEKRKYRVHDLAPAEIKYELYLRLNKLWDGYMCSILGIGAGRSNQINAVSDGNVIATADFHGAAVEIVKSSCVGRVGIKGIVVKETKFMLDIVTPGDTLKNVPKEGTTFRLIIAVEDSQTPIVLELDGDALKSRPSERANKKWKPHFRLDD